jgi:tetratricopeptide (TPR) repeat protein
MRCEKRVIERRRCTAEGGFERRRKRVAAGAHQAVARSHQHGRVLERGFVPSLPAIRGGLVQANPRAPDLKPARDRIGYDFKSLKFKRLRDFVPRRSNPAPLARMKSAESAAPMTRQLRTPVPFASHRPDFFASARSEHSYACAFTVIYIDNSICCVMIINRGQRRRGRLPWAQIRVSVQLFSSGPQNRRIGRRCSMAFGTYSKSRLRRTSRGAGFSMRLRTGFFICLAFGAAAFSDLAARAQDVVVDEQSARAEQARLADHIRQHPTDYDATYRYVILSTELKDFEAGIGALERLLTFNPALSRARKELGFLYARLGAYQIAAQHLRRALESGDLDAVQVAQIEAQLPEIEKQNEASRWYGRFQVGVRSQSNASFFPSNDLFRVGGVDRAGLPLRRSDFNSFELGEVAHDYDFQNQRGDRFETRLSGYATQQFNLSQYNVGLLGISAGPRLALAPDALPGVTVKPYVTGLVSSMGNVNYLNSGGVGFSVNAPVGPMFSIEPGFEWRALSVNTRGVTPLVSTLASGDALRASLAGYLRPMDDVRIEARLSYTRGNAHNSPQSFDQFEAQGSLRIDFDPPVDIIGRKWTIAPYGRVFQIQFDSANFFLDPFRARRDVAWTTGLAFDAPITANFGFASAIEYSRNWSNLPNFNTDNLSVIFGPVAKF